MNEHVRKCVNKEKKNKKTYRIHFPLINSRAYILKHNTVVKVDF